MKRPSILDVCGISNNRGFSLVELIAVVTIVGILTVLVMPQYKMYRLKAFQAEAKTQLTAIHSAEQTFFLEYQGYHASLNVIGYAPSGRARYNSGFGALGAPASKFVATFPANTFNSRSICMGLFGSGSDNRCQMIIDTPVIPNTATVAASTYLATSMAFEDKLISQSKSSPFSQMAMELLVGADALASSTVKVPTSDGIEINTPSGYDSWVIDQNGRMRSTQLQGGP